MLAKGEDMFEAHSFMVLVAKRIDMLFSKQAKPVSATTRGAPVLAIESSDLGLSVGKTGEKTRGLASAAAELPSLAGERGVCQVPEGEQVRLQVVQVSTLPPNMKEALGLIPATSQDHVGTLNAMPCRRVPAHAHALDDPEYVQLPVGTMVGFRTPATA